MNKISIASIYENFFKQMVWLQLLIGLLLIFAFWGGQFYFHVHKDQQETQQIAKELREALLSGREVEVIQYCKQFFQNDRTVSIAVSFNNDELCNLKRPIPIFWHSTSGKIYFSESDTANEAGLISVSYSLVPIFSDLINYSLALFIAIGIFLVFIVWQMKRIENRIIRPVTLLAKHFMKASSLDKLQVQYDQTGQPLEVRELITSFNQMTVRISELDAIKKNAEREQVFVQLAKQVAHDIRSPLSALNIANSTLGDAADTKRQLIGNAIQRINDIANDLLAKGKHGPALQESSVLSTTLHLSEATPILLPELIDTVVAEKRIQLSDNKNIRIETDFADSKGSYVTANSKELMRVISNLINNSIEALTNSAGEIVVSVRSYRHNVLLSIKDNGIGIPKQVLEKLGEAGISYGKENSQSGSGLGVYHAKKTIDSFGGKLQISSNAALGTLVDIHLPRATTHGY